MQSVTHSHRSYHNLKAFQAASDLCADLFWQSRTFPSSLQRSLTAPLRDRAFRVYQSVLRVWRHRHDVRRAESYVDLALDEIWMLQQYVLRAREEEVLREGEFERTSERIRALQVQVRRLPNSFDRVA